MRNDKSVQDRVKELTARLEEGVKEVFASGRYAEYLRAMSKFHAYSYGNVLLILAQCPHASRVAGYHTWKELGRHVKRGEAGISILAPAPYHMDIEVDKKDPHTGATLYGTDGKPLKETQQVQLTRFFPVTVFDISQTEGKELPSVGVSELTGEVPDFKALYDKLVALSPLPITQKDFPGEAKGYCDHTAQSIVIRSGMSQVQTIKTTIHEIAHAKLHDPKAQEEGEQKGRHQKEVEAESVAYVVSCCLGLDTSEYSFGYVAGWSRGKELDELKASLATIQTTAAEIIHAIYPQSERKPPAKSKPKHRRQAVR